jgi:hypothetical protein
MPRVFVNVDVKGFLAASDLMIWRPRHRPPLWQPF